MYVIILIIHIVCHNSSQWILDVLICNWIGTYLGVFPEHYRDILTLELPISP